MVSKASRRLVIDASVVRSAGPETATVPLSKRCRDFLKSTMSAGHQAVITPAIKAEWDKHQSGFVRQWRTTMVARQRLLFVNVPEDVALREQIEAAAARDRDRKAMLKDALLIEAAQATDRTVAALDDTVRKLFTAASSRVRTLKTIVWVNPGDDDRDACAWFEEGAPPDKKRWLGARPASR
jgi:hypothetical protein